MFSETFKTLSILGDPGAAKPSKPYQYWVPCEYPILQNPINTGFAQVPSSFKTLSILGSRYARSLQNPINTGEPVSVSSFKTLSILGSDQHLHPSKPYQYWAAFSKFSFKTLSILGVYHIIICI